jgi:membrane dipeptidase
MSKLTLIVALISGLFIYNSCDKKLSDEELKQKAKELAHKFTIIDTHIDAPIKMYHNWKDIADSTDRNFDYHKAKLGGLNIPFMSIYVPASTEGTDKSTIMADSLINLTENLVRKNPDKFSMIYSVKDVLNNKNSGKIGLAMGMENGSPINNDLNNLIHFFERGIRYITLCHSKWNHICDSSYDEDKHWNGLSPFGKKVVREMNRLGIIIDISHVSDSTFYYVLKLTKAPVIASHSSCRYFTPGFERNMSDAMIQVLAQNGGVIQINFGLFFIDNVYKLKSDTLSEVLKEKHLSYWDPEAKPIIEEFKKSHNIKYAPASEVAKHIDHVVKLVGIDYVGIGSDFDGVGDGLPKDLNDVSKYPNLIYELLKIGYSDKDIEKICSGNLLRVWQEVEKIANQKT